MTTKTASKPKPKKAPAADKAPKARALRTIEGNVPVRAKKVSALDAAAKVLGEAGKPMNCKDLIETMATKGYWTTPKGKTPHATLYAAIMREINTKGKETRFKKVDRGEFALAR
jgi:hypothetical protein